MTRRLQTSFTLLKASSFPPLPSSPVSFPGESLDLSDRMTTAPTASLPSWRRHLGSSAGGGRLLSPEGFCLCACLHSSTSSGLQWSLSGGCFAALFVGGYFAAVVVLVIVLGGSFVALVDWVDALPPLPCSRSLHLWRCSIFCRFQLRSCLGLRGHPCLPRFSCCCYLLFRSPVTCLVVALFSP